MRYFPYFFMLSFIHAAAGVEIPGDFPHYIVPGQEKAMESLRQLNYLHYQPAGPLATLWDEWISGPTLWPAVETDGRMDDMRRRWAKALSERIIDADGYVATHQHNSIAHQLGWPFPFWKQGGEGTWGWHFSLQGVPQGWHGTSVKTQEGWELTGGVDKGISDDAWNIDFELAGAFIRTPTLSILPDQSPFIQLRWRASGLDNAQPYLEWTTEENPAFSPERRFYFEPIRQEQGIVFTMIPVFKSPAWKGRITRLGMQFDNPPSGAAAGIQALFTQYDTRHNINNQNYVRGCAQYFRWTRDLNFLRHNLNRMRLALLYLMENQGGLKEKCIMTPFVGHDGRSGMELTPDGKKIIHSGRGIGNNYWDLLPMGRKDAYATIHYYDALNTMISLEKEIAAHPEWNMPGSPMRKDPEDLRRHAEEVKAVAGRLFWNIQTGRFFCGIDDDGVAYDYGFSFLNCDAIYYDFAAARQAESILSWLNGDRIVKDDSSQGEDIYHWRFAPRATTKRNIEYYGWFWNSPEKIPWGGQVQDGGAVLGFSYQDLMSRLKVLGPDNAWKRLQEIIRWFDEVQAGGGYREYYKDGSQGTLQGGGHAGGLGLDQEFFESLLVPQIMLRGFLGFQPRGDGFQIQPQLPKDWPQVKITRIHLHRMILDILVEGNAITLTGKGNSEQPFYVYAAPGSWSMSRTNAAGEKVTEATARIKTPEEGIPIQFDEGDVIRLAPQ